MKFYEFGDKNNPVILLLPGTCCHWKANFETVIPFLMEMFGIGSARMAFVRRESIRNQFYSDLVTPVGDEIFVHGTTVHIFYAVKMGKKYLERYHRHFKNPDIRRHEMQHEELLVCYPRQWAEEVRNCCEL